MKISWSWPCIFIPPWLLDPSRIGPSRQFVVNCHVTILFYSLPIPVHTARILQKQQLFIPLASYGIYYFSHLLFTYHFLITIKLHIMLYLIHSFQTLTSSSQQCWHSLQECYLYHALGNLAQVKKVAVPQWFRRKVSLVYCYYLVELDMHSLHGFFDPSQPAYCKKVQLVLLLHYLHRG